MFGKPAVKNDSLWADICNLMFGRKVWRTPKCTTCSDTHNVYYLDGSVHQDELLPCPDCRPLAHHAAVSFRNDPAFSTKHSRKVGSQP